MIFKYIHSDISIFVICGKIVDHFKLSTNIRGDEQVTFFSQIRSLRSSRLIGMLKHEDVIVLKYILLIISNKVEHLNTSRLLFPFGRK